MLNLDHYPKITLTMNNDIIEILEEALPTGTQFAPHLNPLPHHTLKDDYGIDSLMKIDVQISLERALNITIPDDTMYDIKTVEQLYSQLNQLL